MLIEVYSDGSATVASKPGGYGWVVIVDGKFHSEGSGSLEKATNNDAELAAAITGLANAYKIAFPPITILGQHEPVETVPPTVTLVSDSQIVLGWLSGTYRFKQLSKQQRYFQLMRLKHMMNVTGRWVEGHSGNEWNERCDKLANAGRLGVSIQDIDKKTKKTSKKVPIKVVYELIGRVSDKDTADFLMKEFASILEKLN